MTFAGGLPGAALRRVLQYIETNLHRDLKLTELSATVYMSAFHFARLFKLSTGVSPHRFVVGRRITYAKQLLVEDGLSIAAISRVVGFRAPSHFTSTFRRVTGITPSTYRAQARAVPPPTPGGPISGRVEPHGFLLKSIDRPIREALCGGVRISSRR